MAAKKITGEPPLSQRTDVAIIFALQEEFEYFVPYIQDRYKAEQDDKTGRTFLLFDEKTRNGRPYAVAYPVVPGSSKYGMAT
jgi:hypothetical protein